MVVENNIRAAAILRDIAQRLKELAGLIEEDEKDEKEKKLIQQQELVKKGKGAEFVQSIINGGGGKMSW